MKRFGWSSLILLVACASTRHVAPAGEPMAHPPSSPTPAVLSLARGAQLLEGLGTWHRAVTTRSAEAQAYFDQGLRLTYGFNHDEATRSFARAAELDGACAMCFWGVSLTLGPNYNVPMLPDRAQNAWEALQRALALAPHASPVEQALISALAKRYSGPAPKDPQAQHPFDQAYAAAMREVARQFPADDDVQVLFAEALMDVSPWKLWVDGKPAPGTEEVVGALETVLKRNPSHPGANHYYIHAIEASPHPERAEASADRLAALMPEAGHIVHMPAHIYQRVGRYAEASETNRRATAADLRYMGKTRPPGYYPMYLGHNYGFLAFSASMEGRAAESLEASRSSVKAVPPEMLDMMPGMDFFASEPLLVMVRFGMWDAILKEPRPAPKYQTLTALWLHARGMALASLGKAAEARAALDELHALAAQIPGEVHAGQNPAKALADLGAKAVEARLAEKQGNRAKALTLWREAVKLEDGLAYSEPADWFYPMRHFLGATLLEAHQTAEAEAVFRRDLEKNPKNGWALFGLWQALKAEKKRSAAQEAEKAFHAAWTHSDIKLARAAF